MRMAVTAIVFATLVGYASYIGLRLRVTYSLNAQVEKLAADAAVTHALHLQVHDQINARLDELERLMFGEVLAKIDAVPGKPRTIASVQLWQKNRDEELRKRIAALEQWRAKIDDQRRD